MKGVRLHPYLPVIGVIGLIALWYAAVWFEVVDKVLLPSPTDTFRALWKGMTSGRLAFDFWRTVERTSLATLIAAAISIPLGVFLGKALGVQIDDKHEGHIPFDRCLAVGCQAQLLLEAPLLAKLRNGKTLVFIIYRTQEAGVGIPISLSGFGPAVAVLR